MSEGTDSKSAFSKHVLARLLEFTSARSPWNRRLWNVGSILALEEVYEAGRWVDGGVLSQKAVDWQRAELQRVLGQDPAIGSAGLRRELQRCLRSQLAVSSDSRRRLRELIDQVRGGYLDRLAAAVADGDPPGAERVARLTASHLLDSGHSFGGLQDRLRGDPSNSSAMEILESAAEMVRPEPVTWTALVPLADIPAEPNLTARLGARWLAPQEARQIVQDEGHEAPERLAGAFIFDVRARDAQRAVELTNALVRRIHSRESFAQTSGRLVIAGSVFVLGVDRTFRLRTESRQAVIHSLVTEGVLYDVAAQVGGAVTAGGAVDDALEVAAALNAGSAAAAISGGWAALESLLTDAKDPDAREGKVLAATRAAQLVASSWPRAELTALAHRVRDDGDPEGLQRRVAGCATNRERARLVAEHLMRQNYLPLIRSWRFQADVAAKARMVPLLSDPAAVLGDVRRHLEVAFRQLYRGRNIVLHGGSTGGVALEATIRVAAPLVGAALDRVAHAYLVQGVPPLELAARADLGLSLVGDPMGRHVCDLLE